VLTDRLSLVRDRWRTSRVLTGLLALSTVAPLLTTVACVAEALLHLPSGARWALLVTGALSLAAAGAWLVARPMVERISLARIARMVETHCPDLGNILIGGLQLASADTPSPALAAAALGQAAGCSARLDPGVTVDRRRMARLGRAALGACALLLLAFAASPARMASAFQRLLTPGRFVPRVGSVRILDVQPGDATLLAGSELAVRVLVESAESHRHPAGWIFHQGGGSPEVRRRMESGDGRTYVHVIRSVDRNLRYRVEIGDTQSGYYRLTVLERPAVTRIDLTYRYPKFTGKEDERLENVGNREIRVPEGTEVRVDAHTNRPMAQAYVDFGDGTKADMEVSGGEVSATFRVGRSGSYAVVLQDRQGHRNLNPARYPIVALPDAPPRVRLTAPGRDTEVAVGGALPLAIVAEDDYGMASLRLVFRRNRGGEIQELISWPDLGGARSSQRAHTWRLAARDFDPGDVVYYFAEAADRVQTGRSPTFQVKLIDPREAREARLKSLAEFTAALRKVLERQLASRAGAGALFTKPPADDQLLSGCRLLTARQKTIRANTLAAAEKAPGDDPLARKVRDAVLLLAAGAQLQAVGAAESLSASAAAARAGAGQLRLTSLQDRIVRQLRELLQIMEKLEAQATEEDDAEASDLPDDVEKALSDLHEKLREFMEEQKKVLEAWNELAKRPVEDLTEEEKKKLEALAATEDKWEKFLKDAHSDLSKLHKQDFTDPKLIKELVETYSEVEMAKDALTEKTGEIPVPVEQAGLESAEALTTHIEKWLPDTPDREQWSMEEPLTEGQTPMAELPEQLEDLIGDLMEEQEDIFEEMEDTTSSWTDSLDKGAGWDTLDGPISNMSAQGVTGNRLPNSSEISGRSGEGRTGKAAGEFVEQTATGKGGRRTPTRLTPDQFLKGQIDDKSKDSAGGSTGGGKVGGAGGEGLEGPPPPETDAETARLAGRQAQILSRAERIRLELKLRNHPTADLDRVISLMRNVESDIKDGHYRNISRKRNVLLEGLKTTRDFAAATSRVQRESTRALPKRLRDELYDAVDGGVPDGYEELVKRYYQSISQDR
jgi:hypothetical protein